MAARQLLINSPCGNLIAGLPFAPIISSQLYPALMTTTPDYYIETFDTGARPTLGVGNCGDEANQWAFDLAQAAFSHKQLQNLRGSKLWSGS
jgi:hypothetical protein